VSADIATGAANDPPDWPPDHLLDWLAEHAWGVVDTDDPPAAMNDGLWPDVISEQQWAAGLPARSSPARCAR
jgi:hypothetical protein